MREQKPNHFQQLLNFCFIKLRFTLSKLKYKRIQIQYAAVIGLILLATNSCGSPGPSLLDLSIPLMQLKTEFPNVMNEKSSYVIKISLVSKTNKSLASIIMIEKAKILTSDLTPVGTPNASIHNAFGPGYEPYATANLASDAFKITLLGSAQQNLRQESVEWDWNVTPQEVGTQVISTDIEIQWLPTKKEGQILPPTTYRIGDPQLSVNVNDPNNHSVYIGNFEIMSISSQAITYALSISLAGILVWSGSLLLKKLEKKNKKKNIQKPATNKKKP